MSAERREAYFSGHVQGVGFRDTAWRIAGGFAVTGFVRNLPDGRVHLVAEGEASQVAGYLAAVRERMADYVRDMTQDVRPEVGEFERFEIRI